MINLGAQHENLDQKVYSILKDMIIGRKLLPGQKIPQEKLARDLGISRTPLIGALKFLEQDKLVESVPRKGFFVRLFSKEEMVYIFELREVLEGLAARRAASKINDSQIIKLNSFFQHYVKQKNISDYKGYAREDRRFHNFVTEVGAKEFLKSILLTTNIISFSYQVLPSEGLVRPPNETIQEHLAMIEAIKGRDSEAAEELMRQHFKKSLAYLKRELNGERKR
ncbi:Transcriptional regulator, GntR family [Olavius sp. associated proteobacterium Delta 1]|nr:Transcriptional regulator, GntR family [Olavius sp. associated proteobacterium Delta 1]